MVCIASSHALRGLGVSSDFSAPLGRQSDRPMIRDLQFVKHGHFLCCTVLNVYDFWKVSMAKYNTLIFETIRLNYTGPSADKPLLLSFVFLFGGSELFLKKCLK